MKTLHLLFFVLLILPSTLSAQESFGAPLIANAKIAFLGMHFIDTSTEGAYNGVRSDEVARLALVEQEIIKRLTEEGFIVLSNAPIQDKLDHTTNPAKCNGCDVRLAEELGANYVLVGEIQKVSNLILSMNMVMRIIPQGEMVRGLSVDFRSNTDETWLRAMTYIFKNHVFKGE